MDDVTHDTPDDAVPSGRFEHPAELAAAFLAVGAKRNWRPFLYRPWEGVAGEDEDSWGLFLRMHFASTIQLVIDAAQQEANTTEESQQSIPGDQGNGTTLW